MKGFIIYKKQEVEKHNSKGSKPCCLVIRINKTLIADANLIDLSAIQ